MGSAHATFAGAFGGAHSQAQNTEQEEEFQTPMPMMGGGMMMNLDKLQFQLEKKIPGINGGKGNADNGSPTNQSSFKQPVVFKQLPEQKQQQFQGSTPMNTD